MGLIVGVAGDQVGIEFVTEQDRVVRRSKKLDHELVISERSLKDGADVPVTNGGSCLARGRGDRGLNFLADQMLAEGRERFELWVAAAVLANNLMKIATLLMDRSLRRRKAA